MSEASDRGTRERSPSESETLSAQPTDLVCGMKVDPATAKVSSVGGVDYYFCCERCQRSFDRKPGLYIGQSPAR